MNKWYQFKIPFLEKFNRYLIVHVNNSSRFSFWGYHTLQLMEKMCAWWDFFKNWKFPYLGETHFTSKMEIVEKVMIAKWLYFSALLKLSTIESLKMWQFNVIKFLSVSTEGSSLFLKTKSNNDILHSCLTYSVRINLTPENTPQEDWPLWTNKFVSFEVCIRCSKAGNILLQRLGIWTKLHRMII